MLPSLWFSPSLLPKTFPHITCLPSRDIWVFNKKFWPPKTRNHPLLCLPRAQHLLDESLPF